MGPPDTPSSLCEVRVVVGVRRDAAAEDPDAVVSSRQPVPAPRWDEDRIARGDDTHVTVDLELAPTLDDEVDLLAAW
jgi:hypothetical protein